MPLYIYECPQCHTTLEEIHTFKYPQACLKCSRLMIKRVTAPGRIQMAAKQHWKDGTMKVWDDDTPGGMNEATDVYL